MSWKSGLAECPFLPGHVKSDLVKAASLSNSNGFTFQSNIYMSQGTDVGLAFDVQSGGASMYFIRASGNAGDLDYAGDPIPKTALWKKAGGSWSKLSSGAGARMVDQNGKALIPQAGQLYTLKVTVSGSTISWSYLLNGVSSIGYVMSDSTFSSGGVGLRVGNGGGANTDCFTGAQLLVPVNTYTYDSANELTQIKDASGNVITTLGYDAAGNNTSETTGGVTTTRTYDERNRLTSVSGGTVNVAYTYDGLGSLYTRNNQNLTGNATTYRYNDVNGALTHELNTTGGVKAFYVSDSKGNPVSVTRYDINGHPVTYSYHTNAHGDVVAITDGSNGNIVASFSYDAWGAPTEYNGTLGTPENLGTWTTSTGGTAGDGLYFLFGSMLYDAATGLYLTKTRAYNPKTGRFLQRDILDESGKKGVYQGFPFGKDAIGTNLYAWCGNNPVSKVDRSLRR